MSINEIKLDPSYIEISGGNLYYRDLFELPTKVWLIDPGVSPSTVLGSNTLTTVSLDNDFQTVADNCLLTSYVSNGWGSDLESIKSSIAAFITLNSALFAPNVNFVVSVGSEHVLAFIYDGNIGDLPESFESILKQQNWDATPLYSLVSFNGPDVSIQQSFTADSNCNLTSFNFNGFKGGVNPAGTVVGQITDVNGNVIATSTNSIDIASLPGIPVVLSFEFNPVALTSGTTYRISGVVTEATNLGGGAALTIRGYISDLVPGSLYYNGQEFPQYDLRYRIFGY